ncbi:MAG: hypothetical protein ACRDPC_21650 [Solirubrobacteraceae bacterium]
MSEFLITGGLLVAYVSLRGTGLALGALETVVTAPRLNRPATAR